ncbi:MAG TPA: carbohydrate kinase family protein [Candidatus Paceibacterota bacterium]|nr:carbohydrate kinase family protein [Candidatus Paceibacterota bacterium]
MKYDFVSFGDITIDAFIRLKDARVNCDINDENCMLCVKFGQKIPFESVQEVFAVGNGPNAAVAAVRLGLASTVVANVGNDRNGDDCIMTLQKEGMNTEFVRKHEGIKTNYHYVLQYEAERTILVKHEKFPYALPQFSEPPMWFYLTSLPLDTLDYQLEIARYAKHNGVKLAFQPGTFQMQLGKEKLAEVYQVSDIFFCNKEESQQILATPDEHDLKNLLQGIRNLGPKIAVITDGRNGSYLMDESGAYHAPMYPDPAPPVSRTGAGDATASTTVAYIIKGLEPKDALLHGMINSAYVVQKVGAQAGLLRASEIEALFAKRPSDFAATPL